MFSFLRAQGPPRTNNAANNPIIYDQGRSSVTFRGPDNEYIMTHRIAPTTATHGVSIVAPPHHYHVYQNEYFHVQSGIGNFYRGFDKTPFAILSGTEGSQKTASVKAGQFHRFENASQTEDLVVDIHLAPGTYEGEERFFRNFFGYLDDCRNTNRVPNVFQLLVILNDADTPVAVRMPWNWLSRLASRAFTVGGAFIGTWVLGFQTTYPEYFEQRKLK